MGFRGPTGLRAATAWGTALLFVAGAAAAGALPTRSDRPRARPAPVAAPAAEVLADDAATPPATTGDAPVLVPPTSDAAAPHAVVDLPAKPDLDSTRLQAALDAFRFAHPTAGTVAVGVARTLPGGAVWTGGDGDVDQLYGSLSITKTFTEALVLREAAAGSIDLDAAMPQIEGVPPLPAGVVITPRMLVQHTSGVVNYMSAVGYDATKPITPKEIVSISLRSPLLAPPGTKASYSNTNFHWLGLLLEHVTGRTYADLVLGLALETGLPSTTLDPVGRPGWIGYASGGVRSTVADLTQWGAALFTPGRVLDEEQLDLLTTPGSLGVSHGLWPLAGGMGQFVAHGGIVFYPADNVVVVVRIDPGTSATGAQFGALAAALRDAARD